MDQPSLAEKAHNEADTNNLDVLSHPDSPTSYHRPRHGRVHHHHSASRHHGESHHHSESHRHGGSHHHSESHHHGGSHHHGRSHHLGEFQDFHDNAPFHHSHHSHHSHHHGEAHHHGRAHHHTSLALTPSQSTIYSHHSPGEGPFDGEYHHGSRRHHGRPHHRGEPHHHGGSHHRGSPHRGEPHHQGGSHYYRGSYHHGRSHHHGEPYDHGGSHHHGESYHRGGSHYHREPHHHARPHHHSEDSHHSGLHYQGEPHYHKDSYTYGGSHHHGEASHHGRHRHHKAHHHRGPLHHGETFSHHSYVDSYHNRLIPHYSDKYSRHHRGHHGERHHGHHGEHHHREHHRSVHRYDYLHGDHRYREYYHGSSHSLGPYKSRGVARAVLGPSRSHSVILRPNMARVQHSAFSLTRSHSVVHSHASQRSSRVHPQDSSIKTSSESWTEDDEQFQKRKTARAQRAHKRLHTMDLFGRLWENLSYLIQDLRKMLKNLTQSLPFEAFIFLVVCLNTIMLVAQTFAEVEIRGEWYFMAFDSIFLCIYVVEAALKITALGFKYFSDPWNNLDFFIMIMAMLDFLLFQYNSFSFVYHQSVFRIFKVFKSLRALRAVRVLRRLSFLTSLQEVTGTLVRSLPSITAILILMFTCLFLFSVVLRALFRHSDPKRFQSIPSTIFTLFTMLTLDDWSLIYLDSRAQGAWYIIPILMIYIIIQYFIFLNLVIAVLVDNFQMALLQGLEKLKQERAAWIREKILDDSLTELSTSDPEEVMSEHTRQKQLIEKKFGTMTEKQQALLFHFLQLVAGVEQHQQKFRSQASVLDEIADTAFEAGEEDFRK
ncbi:cation channel sperm-associated protein 1 [Meles meles]|uniref:cation channel sperm-associated protein 1 n=1 Tax=Meles meles TaxID=9662 RepID=UPI001E69F3D9|nr:cation channel sperm-associated protein 1 [Meles meles]